MKTQVQKRFAFVAKSLLWSVLLYTVMMLAFNWDEVNRSVRGTNDVTIVNAPAPGDQQGTHTSVHSSVKGIITILRAISGFTVKAAN